ncbi:hypothetical protein [Burkholderia cenocepacia]|uniref:hypothetical protein n=1 Tax=Burkholderia cenocepacia TaxID=95486 RepID=UPI000A7C9281|nr:hypothetical protein [Burkholderia cenocepacia]
MLDSQNVFEVSRAGYALMGSRKWEQSRALRRFLSGFVLPVLALGGKALLQQSFAHEAGYSSEQLDALERYAAAREENQREYLPEGAVRFLKVVRDNDYGSIFNSYELAWDPATASLKQLQLLVKVVIVLADSLHEFAAFPNENALRSCPEYRYRGYGISVAKDEHLWCVCGQDVRGGSGVLEWCDGEDDANEMLAKMNSFPERFIGLTAGPYLRPILSPAS